MNKFHSNIIFFSMVIFLLSSCFKEDEKIEIPKPSGLETDTIELGHTYYNQVWIDLNSLEEKANHKIDTWDLAFSCDPNSFDIKLNSALTMYAGTNKETVFGNIISEEGVELKFDASSGNTDSLAFGGWYTYLSELNGDIISNEYVYVVNRGINSNLIELGFKKVQFFIEEQNYIIKYANLDGTEENTFSITKDINYNYIHLSFENGIVQIEPPKDEWSLKFSRYSTILFTDEGDPYDYNVVGILLNPNNVLAIETDKEYDDIELADVSSLELTNRNDVIGYDWKYYDFDNGTYTIVPDKNYIIKDIDGFFYKLRFLSFYDQFGNKGSIVYQVVRL